jgi:DedD protein
LEGKTAKPSAERVVIQVGAFSDAAKVREARQKLEAAGFKTYTQVIDAKDGKRTRVRVGPFETKAEADKSAQKIRKLQLDAAILKL